MYARLQSHKHFTNNILWFAAFHDFSAVVSADRPALTPDHGTPHVRFFLEMHIPSFAQSDWDKNET
jgi:hypothetical protein